MSDNSAISIVKGALPISQYVARYTDSLKSLGGGKYKSVCIAHGGDNETAMSIDDNKGLWFCHSSECGGGSIIDLWMKKNDSKDIGEAITRLGQELNLSLPEHEGGSYVSQRRILDALKAVQEEAQDFLLNDDHDDAEAAREYLKKRGVNRSIIKSEGIGILPSGREASNLILEVCDDEEALIKSGVMNRDSKGALWSPMNGRIHFPIRDESGAVVAFGARAIDSVSSSMAGKYVNTHETSVYHKSQVLYGQHLINKKTDSIVVVEGYLDVIAVNRLFDQNDMDNYVAVATCGTSLADGHVNILNRFDNITFMFDGDEAGLKASVKTIKSANILRDKGRISLLEAGSDDPWSMYAAGLGDKVLDSIEDSSGMFEIIVSAKWKLSNENESELIDWMRDVIPTLSYSHHRDTIINECASRSGISQTALKRDLAVPVDMAARRLRNANSDSMSQPARSLCRYILSLDDDVKRGLFAGIMPWSKSSEETVSRWLPIDTEMDLHVFKKIVLGADDTESHSSVDTTVAELMSETEDDDPEASIQFMLRGMAKQELVDLTSLKVTGPIGSMQVKMVRSTIAASKNKSHQVSVFAFLLDTAMDIDDRIQDRATRVA